MSGSPCKITFQWCGVCPNSPITNPKFLKGSGIFAPSPDTTKGHVTSLMLIITSTTHKLKAPRDQLPPAPPDTPKACIQPVVFNSVLISLIFFFSFFPFLAQVNQGHAAHQLQVKVHLVAGPIKTNN